MHTSLRSSVQVSTGSSAATGNGGHKGGYAGTAANAELGYQLLDTRFTGASSDDLTGAAGYWEIL